MNDELMLLLERVCPEAMELLNAERQAKSKMFQQYDKRIAELDTENKRLKNRGTITSPMDGLFEENERLKAKLDAIANYPDPDFPMEDTEEELKRAWQIIYRLKGMAALGEAK